LGGVAAEAVEFFFIGLVAAFDLAIETRGARGDQAMLSCEAVAHSGKGVDLYGAIERGFRAGGIPVSEDGVVIGLDDADRKGERREGILDEGFRGIGGHLLAELDEAQAGAAVDGGILVESSAFDEVRDEFDIDLEEVAGARDGEEAAVAFGAWFSASGEAVEFKEFVDGEGGGDLFEVLV